MRVLYIVPDLVVGGVTSVVLSNITELQKKNCEILLVSLSNVKIFDQTEFPIKTLGVPKRDVIKFITSLRKFHTIIQQFKPDIIHSHTYNANVYVRLYSMIYKNNIIKICNEHGTLQEDTRSFRYAFYKHTKQFHDYFVNVSDYSLNSYIKLGLFDSKRSTVLYNGIDTDKYQFKISNNTLSRNSILVFGYIGRLSEEKDPLNLLEAVTYLKSITDRKFKVIIVGDGPEMEVMEKYLVNNNIEHLVSLVGMQKDIVSYLKKIDILVLPSKTEGLPTVVLEAMSMNRLVVATNCGGIREIFRGVESFIVDIENSRELALMMQNIMRLTLEQRVKLGDTYRSQILEYFSIKFTTRKIYELYELLINEN